MTNENPINAQITAVKSEISDLSMKIQSLEKSLAMLNQKKAIAQAKLDAFEISAGVIEGLEKSKKKSKTGTRNRMPASEWKQIFSDLYLLYRSSFSYKNIMTVARARGQNIKQGSLRTKMMKLKREGYVTSEEFGEFRLTTSGLTYFGINSAEESIGEYISPYSHEGSSSQPPNQWYGGGYRVIEPIENEEKPPDLDDEVPF